MNPQIKYDIDLVHLHHTRSNRTILALFLVTTTLSVTGKVGKNPDIMANISFWLKLLEWL